MDAAAVLPLVGSFFILSLVFLGTAWTIRTGMLERNGVVGIRTRATKVSDQAWAAGHRAAYGALRMTGWLCLGVGVLTTMLALVVRGRYLVPVVLSIAVVGYVALVVGLIVIVREANAGARNTSTRPPN